ncbi:MAG TPA: glycosyltransferase [Candidatus Binatia bacterium]
MRLLVLTKRQYMAKDLLDDRFGRYRELPLELAQRGHEVRGICLSYRPRTAGRFDDADAENKIAVAWLAVNLGDIGFYLKQANKWMAEFRPDIVWAGSDVFHVVFGTWLARRYGARSVADLYDDYAAFAATRLAGALPLYRRALRRADGVTCFSRRMAELVERDGRRGPTTVVESGVRTDLFQKLDKGECRAALGLPRDAKIIGTAGALYKSRGIDTLLKAFEMLAAERPIHLALAGDRDVALPRRADVHDLGMLPPDRVPVFFGALDVAVSCYRDSAQGRVSFPQKAYEIIACGTPLVAAAVGSMQELLAGHPECLFDPEYPESLARAVLRQLENPTAVGVRAPGWAEQAVRLEKFFLEVLQAEQ